MVDLVTVKLGTFPAPGVGLAPVDIELTIDRAALAAYAAEALAAGGRTALLGGAVVLRVRATS